MVKTYEQFLNENLAGEYCYFGNNALVPIVMKLHQEGWTSKKIYDYLTSLGVKEKQKIYILDSLSNQGIVEGVDDLVSADIEDEIADIKKKKDVEDESGKDSEETEKKDAEEEDTEDGEEDSESGEDSEQMELLKKILKDQSKLDKIRKVLKEHKIIDKESKPKE